MGGLMCSFWIKEGGNINPIHIKKFSLLNCEFCFRIGDGTSHFGSGTIGLFKPIAERNIILYSIKLYRQLQAKGFDIGEELKSLFFLKSNFLYL